MLNDDQADYVRSLHALGFEGRCWCGWFPVGKCESDCNRAHPGQTLGDSYRHRLTNSPGPGRCWWCRALIVGGPLTQRFHTGCAPLAAAFPGAWPAGEGK